MPKVAIIGTAGRVAIIGTAGRGSSIKRLSKDIFDKMCDAAAETITRKFKLCWSEVDLVSGGAAWADHVAVILFFLHDPNSLVLHLPCPWVATKGDPHFLDLSSGDWKTNPGRTANQYHKTFSQMTGRNSLQDIQDASVVGAQLNCEAKGFHSRNTEVAKVDYMIAFTCGEGSLPESGGTLDTWNKSGAKKVHISLGRLGCPELDVM